MRLCATWTMRNRYCAHQSDHSLLSAFCTWCWCASVLHFLHYSAHLFGLAAVCWAGCGAANCVGGMRAVAVATSLLCSNYPLSDTVVPARKPYHKYVGAKLLQHCRLQFCSALMLAVSLQNIVLDELTSGLDASLNERGVVWSTAMVFARDQLAYTFSVHTPAVCCYRRCSAPSTL